MQGGTYGETPCSKEGQNLTQIILLRSVERRMCENSRQIEMEQWISTKFFYKVKKKKVTDTHPSNTFAHNCTGLVSEADFTHQYDKTLTHTAIRLCNFLAKRRVTVLAHPSYSPYLAPSDFFLFPRLKRILKGTRFADIPDIQRRVILVFASIPKENFTDSFQRLYQRCHNCIAVNGCLIP
ncbi:Mariner Mos1 transposase like protein [Argiope bruennichi]|uniref:Mariner Mos1 transposase like protein n=1 Tax=Argiope bruennichi TaxID=94029 RepID=A0A8T0E545_ARGBR|nr:Mariner Mos1 transposase like protein [Argiope bruennichi]